MANPAELLVNNKETAEQRKLKRGGAIRDEDLKKTTQLIYHYHEGEEFHTLCEPRDLYHQRQWPAHDKHTSNLPMWPAEVLCLPLHHHFITTSPSTREQFYTLEEHIVSPKIRSPDGLGTTVYTNMPGPHAYFTHARPGASRGLKPHPPRGPDDIALSFESRFESGNLAKAIQVGRWDYELLLRPDLYTGKHTQWYFFSVGNMRAGQVYRFTIINFYKSSSLYGQALRPLRYSVRDAEINNVGWKRCGRAIKYFKTNIKRKGTKDCYYYAMTWSCDFPYSNDTCYFAHCYPFTYSDLLKHLDQLSADTDRAPFCKWRTLCHTIAGNPVPLVTITSSSASLQESKLKRAVVLTARVHPGETNSSWMMKGLLDYLTSDSPDAMLLRDMFVFKIIPMLNPDGVVIGNYRCSLAGRDLNRNYKDTLKDAYPTVWHCKDMVKKLVAEREIVVFCDLHGHSRKMNVFIYGCENNNNPVLRLKERVFPAMFSRNAPNKFCYKSSRFKVQKSKEGTGRIVMWGNMGITNSYTMEATFCGSSLGKLNGLHFTSSDLEMMGYHFCDTLLDYCDPDQTKVNLIMRELEDERRELIRSRMAALGRVIPDGVDPLDVPIDSELESDMETSDGGSDSSVSDGPPVHMASVEMKSNRKKVKKRRSRKEHSNHGNREKYQLHLTHKPVVTKSAVHPAPIVTLVTQSKESSYKPRGPSVEIRSTSLEGSHAPPATPTNAATGLEKSSSEAGLTSVPSVTFRNRNGGIPIFTQERIEERQRKKSGSSTSIMLDSSIHQLVAIETTHDRGINQGSLHKDCQNNLTNRSTDGMTTLPSNHVSKPQLGAEQLQQGSQGGRGSFTSQYVANHLQDLIASPSGTQLLLSSTVATTTADTNKLVSLSHLFRQQHLPPRPTPCPSFHRPHKEKSKSKMKLSGHHGNDAAGYSLPPMAELFSSDDHHGDYNKDIGSHTSVSSDNIPHPPQLTEDDRQCVNDIRRTQWQPHPLALSSDRRSADAVMYEYHLSQPTTVSIDNTRLPSVRSPQGHTDHQRTNRLTEHSNQQSQLQQEVYKVPSSSHSASSSNDILTTKQLLSTDHVKFTGVAAHHRVAEPVADDVISCGAGGSREDASSNSKVAEIRLVFDSSPSQPSTVPVIGGHRIAHQNAVTRPHTTDWGFPDRLLLPRKPATRSGMKPLAEHPGAASILPNTIAIAMHEMCDLKPTTWKSANTSATVTKGTRIS